MTFSVPSPSRRPLPTFTDFGPDKEGRGFLEATASSRDMNTGCRLAAAILSRSSGDLSTSWALKHAQSQNYK